MFPISFLRGKLDRDEPAAIPKKRLHVQAGEAGPSTLSVGNRASLDSAVDRVPASQLRIRA